MTSEIIKKCINQDRVAQKQLYLDHCHRLMSTANRYAKDMDEAKDIVQNTFIRIFNNLETYNFKKGNFISWTATICIREAIAIKRQNQPLIFKEDIVDVVEKQTQQLEIDHGVSLESLQSAINSLPENYKTILMMYYYDDLNHKEIAHILEIKESSSRSKLSRAKEELTKKWKLTLLNTNY